MTDPYENLVNVIMLQAVKDYRDALKRLKRSPVIKPPYRIQWSVNISFDPAGAQP